MEICSYGDDELDPGNAKLLSDREEDLNPQIEQGCLSSHPKKFWLI
jgi:hypothetical protein